MNNLDSVCGSVVSLPQGRRIGVVIALSTHAEERVLVAAALVRERPTVPHVEFLDGQCWAPSCLLWRGLCEASCFDLEHVVETRPLPR